MDIAWMGRHLTRLASSVSFVWGLFVQSFPHHVVSPTCSSVGICTQKSNSPLLPGGRSQWQSWLDSDHSFQESPIFSQNIEYSPRYDRFQYPRRKVAHFPKIQPCTWFWSNRDIMLRIANFDKTSGYVKRMSTLEMLVASLRQSGVVIEDFILRLLERGVGPPGEIPI